MAGLFLLIGVVRLVPVVDAWQAAEQLNGRTNVIVVSVVNSTETLRGSVAAVSVRQIGGRAVPAGAVGGTLVWPERFGRGTRVRVHCEAWEVREQSALFAQSRPTLRCPESRIIGSSIASAIVQALDRSRQRFIRSLESLPEPSAGLAVGLILGETETLPADIVAAFRQTGTSHILALSGFNVTLLVNLLLTVLPALLGRRPAFVVITLCLIAFLVLTGIPPSLLRATAMAVLLVVARWIGRRAPAERLLALSVTLLLIVQPTLLNDVGFVLSAVSTAGLVLLGDRLLVGWRLPAWIRVTLASSTAAFLTTLPVVLTAFGRLAVVSPLANLLVLPFVPILFFTGLLYGGLGLVTPGLTAWLSAPLVWLTNAFLGIVKWFSQLPFASVHLALPNVLPIFLAVATGLMLIRSRPKICQRCNCPPNPTAVYA